MSPFIAWNSQPLEKWADQYTQGKFIDLDDGKQHPCRTHYIEKGTGEPVILIHGFNYDSYTWCSNIDVLAEKYKVYAIDLWGLALVLDNRWTMGTSFSRIKCSCLWTVSASLAHHLSATPWAAERQAFELRPHGRPAIGYSAPPC